MIDAPMGGVQRFSYNRCDPHVAQPHNRAIRINRNLKDAVIVKEPAIVRVDGRKKGPADLRGRFTWAARGVVRDWARSE
jgi:hypothetical protein